MSVQFGRWNFEGQPPEAEYIEKVNATLAPYAPDGNETYAHGGVKILYRAFHTTKESHHEVQPHVSASGAVITWDGRLDNRAELIGELCSFLKTNAATAYSRGSNFAIMNSGQVEGGTTSLENQGRGPCAMAYSIGPNILSANSTDEYTDVEIVAGAYEKWGADCLGKLIGDWALSIWSLRERSLILAKDFVGTRHLYYSIDRDHVTWSTILDPLVLFAGRTFEICEEYIAGWFSHVPAAHLTPYVGIHAVPSSSSVLLQPGKHGVKHIVSKYWDFDPGKRIRYRTDAEYEEHFRSVFAQAVQRRLRSDRPVLADLSGGMDSSSIVCMADTVIARGQAECPRLDTISCFDSSNPNWDDPIYFAKVEEKRGRIGFHIDLATEKQSEGSEVASENSLLFEFEGDRLVPIPSSRRRLSSWFFKQYIAYLESQGYRVTLSGIGGEQPTGGGTPTPTPEIQNLLARVRLFTLAHQLNAWAAKMRKPRFPLLRTAARGFFPLIFQNLPEHVNSAPPWFHPSFVRRNHVALCCYPYRVKLFGALPSFQEHLSLLNCERRLMAYFALTPDLCRDVRYPYLDRDLREFAYAIPWEQIVHVGQRRFLMRRALVGIVPDELLNRKQKSFAPSDTKKEVSSVWPSLNEIGQAMVSSSIGIIDSHRLLEALKRAQRNEEVPIQSLNRTLFLESWLRHLTAQGVLNNSMATKRKKDFSSLGAKELQASAQPKSSAS